MQVNRSPRPRFITEIKTIYGSNLLAGKSSDISLNGMLATLPALIQDPVILMFKIKNVRIKCVAIPLWTSRMGNGDYQIGFQFSKLSDTQHRVIADYIASAWLQENMV